MSRRRFSWHWFAALWAVWLLLQGHVSLGGALLGGVVALLVVLWLVSGAERFSAMRALPLLRLVARVAWDIPASSVTVAWLVLTRARRVQPAWVTVSLDLPDDSRVVVLAAIVSLTPGTLSVGYDAEAACLLVHALDTTDPDATAREIKSRYESLLLELYA